MDSTSNPAPAAAETAAPTTAKSLPDILSRADALNLFEKMYSQHRLKPTGRSNWAFHRGGSFDVYTLPSAEGDPKAYLAVVDVADTSKLTEEQTAEIAEVLQRTRARPF